MAKPWGVQLKLLRVTNGLQYFAMKGSMRANWGSRIVFNFIRARVILSSITLFMIPSKSQSRFQVLMDFPGLDYSWVYSIYYISNQIFYLIVEYQSFISHSIITTVKISTLWSPDTAQADQFPKLSMPSHFVELFEHPKNLVKSQGFDKNLVKW